MRRSAERSTSTNKHARSCWAHQLCFERRLRDVQSFRESFAGRLELRTATTLVDLQVGRDACETARETAMTCLMLAAFWFCSLSLGPARLTLIFACGFALWSSSHAIVLCNLSLFLTKISSTHEASAFEFDRVRHALEARMIDTACLSALVCVLGSRFSHLPPTITTTYYDHVFQHTYHRRAHQDERQGGTDDESNEIWSVLSPVASVMPRLNCAQRRPRRRPRVTPHTPRRPSFPLPPSESSPRQPSRSSRPLLPQA